MNAAVDFLPESYRRQLDASRTRRERLWLLVPVLGALLSTDMALRTRVGIARDMATQAEAHAANGEQRSAQVAQLAARIAATRSLLERQVAPLAAPRLSPLVESLLAGRPHGLTIQSLSCRHDPWSSKPAPTIRVDAVGTSADAFEAYLGALRTDPSLPPMQCLRTFAGPDAGIGFQLQSAVAAEARR